MLGWLVGRLFAGLAGLLHKPPPSTLAVNRAARPNPATNGGSAVCSAAAALVATTKTNGRSSSDGFGDSVPYVQHGQRASGARGDKSEAGEREDAREKNETPADQYLDVLFSAWYSPAAAQEIELMPRKLAQDYFHPMTAH